MLDELAHFGLVLGVIMMGFTLAFFVLFVDELTYGDTWLDVFKAMLGETDVFEDYYEDELGEVAKLLLVVYLFVVSILLLNLLIGTYHRVVGMCMAYSVQNLTCCESV